MNDYYQEVENDIIDYIEGNFLDPHREYIELLDEMALTKKLSDPDTKAEITGETDRTATWNKYLAEENVSSDWNLAYQAINELCPDMLAIEFIDLGFEYIDVLIRRYVYDVACENAVKYLMSTYQFEIDIDKEE